MHTVGERLPREVRASVLVRLCKRRAGRDERCTARPRPLALGCKTARYCTNQERLPGLSTTYEERARCRPRHHQPVGEMGRTFCFQQVLWRFQSHIQAVIGSITRHPIFLHLPSASFFITQRYVAVQSMSFSLPMIMSLNCKQFCKNLLVRYLHQDINVHLGPAVLGFAHVLRHQHLRIPKSAPGASLTWSGACSYTPSRIPWWHM